jgi:hypothetical protein
VHTILGIKHNNVHKHVHRAEAKFQLRDNMENQWAQISFIIIACPVLCGVVKLLIIRYLAHEFNGPNAAHCFGSSVSLIQSITLMLPNCAIGDILIGKLGF